MKFTIASLAETYHGEIRGDRRLVIEGVQSLNKAGPHDITYAADEKNLKALSASKAGAAFVPRRLAESLPALDARRALVVVDDPQAIFLRVVEQFRPPRPRANIGVSPLAVVSSTARIGKHTNVHPGAYVGDGAVVGDSCDVFPGVCIGRGCVVGNQVALYPNVVLYADVRIGNRVIIHANSVIGADGFGYRCINGRHQKIPHYGTAEIRDDVEIGACSTIDRAAIGTTVIGEGTKIDNHVQIAHNCEIGRHNILVSHVAVAGSAVTGDYVVCAGQSGISDHVTLADGCVLGARAGAMRNLPTGRYHGAPAEPEDEVLRRLMALKKLPEMRQQMRTLERQVAALTRQLEALTKSGEPVLPSTVNAAA